jgi:hypothetical protein
MTNAAAMSGYNQQQQAIAALRAHVAEHDHRLPKSTCVDELSNALLLVPDTFKPEFRPLAIIAAEHYAKIVSEPGEVVVTHGSLVDKLSLIGVWFNVNAVVDNAMARKRLESLVGCYGLWVEIK